MFKEQVKIRQKPSPPVRGTLKPQPQLMSTLLPTTLPTVLFSTWVINMHGISERTRSEKAKASQTQPSTQEFLKTTLLNKDKQTGMKQGVDLSATMKENTRSQRAGENVLMVPPQTK
ncbi:uncharacterized protein LOC110861080 isoform X3 [Folsomia candida]|uniref:uncharacterized protein LOC110861080 isoform X3 n=1 Tax=Folsomia candida TaxID=158441 RepID=UPI000B8FF26F|nr:uncharacterized protein LOC110861080 isoform X3 [Folsomia candida]